MCDAGRNCISVDGACWSPRYVIRKVGLGQDGNNLVVCTFMDFCFLLFENFFPQRNSDGYRSASEKRLDDAVTTVDTDLGARHEAGGITCQEDDGTLHVHQHGRLQQLQGENSQTSLPGHPSEKRVVSIRVSRLWKVGTHATHRGQALPRFLYKLSIAGRRKLRLSAYLELRVVCENGLGELGEHVAGAGYTRVSRRGDRRVTSSNLRQLTRTPFFAHSTAREAAMCFTATRIERD